MLSNYNKGSKFLLRNNEIREYNLIPSKFTLEQLPDIEPVDSEELQLKDEFNRNWVEAWVKAVE